MCDREIETGETYCRTVQLEDSIWVWKTCSHCEAMINECDLHGYTCGDGVDPDTFSEFDAESIFDLRCKVMWRRKWRRKDGTLYPIPKSDNTVKRN